MTSSQRDQPVVLTIAGSDCSGGAGIQADLKTITALGYYGASVITALTAQNTTGVQAVHPTPPDFVRQQIRSILDDIVVDAIKTGMLYDAENARVTVNTLKDFYLLSGVHLRVPPLVCDPVCVSTSGHTLLDPAAIKVLLEDLFPLAMVVTPNKPEAELLLSHLRKPMEILTLDDMMVAAATLSHSGSYAVLLKGGHVNATLEDVEKLKEAKPEIALVRYGVLDENMEILQRNVQPKPVRRRSSTSSPNSSSPSPSPSAQIRLVVDLLHQVDGTKTLFIRPRIESTSTHGTGCTLSAAIACALGQGLSLQAAVTQATIYTHLAIETAEPIGKGNGPLNHLHSTTQVALPQPTESCPYPLTRYFIESCTHEWKAYVEHAFVKQLGAGKLPQKCFVHFIKQDYHYLKYYSRAYGLLAAKSTQYVSIAASAETILNVIHEIDTHKMLCAAFDITIHDLENTPETPETTAYGCYLLDVGLQGDSTTLLVALLACLLGYGEVGLWLKKEAAKPASRVKLGGNPYRKWIDDYSGDLYQKAVNMGLDTIEARAVFDPPSVMRLLEWQKIWEKCTRLERGFWDAAMRVQ